MANLTIAVDDDVLRRARVRAAEQGTSVNAVLRDELGRYAGAADPRGAVDRFLALARSNRGDGRGTAWSREALYADRIRDP